MCQPFILCILWANGLENLRAWAIFSRPCFEKHSWAFQLSTCCKLSKLTIKRKKKKKKIIKSAWVGKLCRHRIRTLHADILFSSWLKSGKNMLMKDTTHNRLTGIGIYSLHTTFYSKIINTQLNTAVFILLIQTCLLQHFQFTR